MSIINRKELDDKAEFFWNTNKVGIIIGASIVAVLVVGVWLIF